MAREVSKQFTVPVKNGIFATGTWVDTVTSSIKSMDKAAANDTSSINFEFAPPKSPLGKGIKINSITIPHFIGTADLDAKPVIVLTQNDFSAVVIGGTVDPTQTVIAQTHDLVVTNKTKWKNGTLTVTTPAYETNAQISYNLNITIDAAAGSVVKLKDLIVNYTEMVVEE